MKKKFKNEDLKYLNGRIDRLCKRFRELEDLIFKWKREDKKDINELKKQKGDDLSK